MRSYHQQQCAGAGLTEQTFVSPTGSGSQGSDGKDSLHPRDREKTVIFKSKKS